MAGHRATQSCCLGQIYGDFAICKGRRCIVVDISLGLRALHVEGMWTSAAGVSKTMTYVKCRREGFNTGWAVFPHHPGLYFLLAEENAMLRVCASASELGLGGQKELKQRIAQRRSVISPFELSTFVGASFPSFQS